MVDNGPTEGATKVVDDLSHEPEGRGAVKVLLAVSALVAVLCGVAVAAVSGILAWVEDEPVKQEERFVPEAPRFKGPLLEVVEGEVLQRVRAEERAVLEGWGWSDRPRGRAHVPIEVAMEVLARRAVAPTETATRTGGAP